ncbi:hypothetical protein [Rhodoblastus sp.]|uniref:hypothetical protein n=1 Tax=Rhodoblastus sp. TaxID=1962975 RepID=UPI003F9974A8
MSDNIIDIAEQRLPREKFAIALAGAIHESFHADPDDPTPIQFVLEEIAEEFLGFSEAQIDTEYRENVAWIVGRQRGLLYIPAKFADQIDIAAHHREAIDWARDLLDHTERNFGVRLLGRARK